MSNEITAIYSIDQSELEKHLRDADAHINQELNQKGFLRITVGGFFIALVFVLVVEQWFGFSFGLSHYLAFLVGLVIAMGFMVFNYTRGIKQSASFISTQDDIRGEVSARFNHVGAHFEDGFGYSMVKWAGIAEVIGIPGATALRVGGIFHLVPDTALQMTPDEFRSHLNTWKSAA